MDRVGGSGWVRERKWVTREVGADGIATPVARGRPVAGGRRRGWALEMVGQSAVVTGLDRTRSATCLHHRVVHLGSSR
nr:hypothetical protein CFP56_36371 [Quercus suber]